MLYLIGGPPKCGKTTLAKALSKELGIPWISTDTLHVVARKYIAKYVSKAELDKLYPHAALKGKTNDETYARATPRQIAKNYIKQAQATYDAVDMFAISEITDGNDYIIEGYHVTPHLVDRLIRKYGREHFRNVFVYKEDVEAFIRDALKSSTPNDWILQKTKEERTLHRIAEMSSYYGRYIAREAKKRGFPVLNMDEGFEMKLKTAIRLLS